MFSLFTALASCHIIFSWRLRFAGDQLSIIGRLPDALTLLQPYTGNQVYVDAYRLLVGREYRIVHQNDIVPSIPPLSDYRHVGLGIWEVGNQVNCFIMLPSHQTLQAMLVVTLKILALLVVDHVGVFMQSRLVSEGTARPR